MGFWDLGLIGLFLLATVWLGIRGKGRTAALTDDYLLAGRTLSLPVFVVTLVATWYGGVLGVGEYSYNHGLSNWLALGVPYYVGALLFALLLARPARLSEKFTVPDLFFDTYGRTAGIAGTALVFVMSLPGAYLLMLGVLLRRATGLSQPLAVLVSGGFCLAYIVLRGFRSVVQTKGFQFALMYGGFLVLLPLAAWGTGGWDYLTGHLPAQHFTWDGGRGGGYIAVWYFIALQTLVEPAFFQRCYAVRSPGRARIGILIAILCFAVFDGLTTLTGMYARAILPDLSSGMDAFPALAERILPPPLLGFFYCGMLATVMSSVDSFLFVGGSTVGRDLAWRLSGGRADQVRWSRWGLLIATLLSTLIGLASSSVVDLWFGFGTVATVTMLLPLLGAFYPALRPQARFVFWGMLLSGGVTVAWLAGRALDPASRPWWGMEPIYPGLAVALTVHLAGWIARKITGREVPDAGNG